MPETTDTTDLVAWLREAPSDEWCGPMLNKAADAIERLCGAGDAWTCGARRQGTAGGNDPADCDWPMCGCDPHANKVIEALEEMGALKDRRAAKAGAWG